MSRITNNPLEAEAFAKRFRELVDSNETTMTELAKAAGTTRQGISRYYNGHFFPSVRVLIAIAKYYNVSTDYLVGLTNYKNIAEAKREWNKAVWFG